MANEILRKEVPIDELDNVSGGFGTMYVKGGVKCTRCNNYQNGGRGLGSSAGESATGLCSACEKGGIHAIICVFCGCATHQEHIHKIVPGCRNCVANFDDDFSWYTP